MIRKDSKIPLFVRGKMWDSVEAEAWPLALGEGDAFSCGKGPPGA